MKPGHGKRKGGAFEREICKKLSLWVTGGARSDVFWRSAMSGGRSTVARKRGGDVRQAGDICAVAPEGHALTDIYYIECKNYRDLQLAAFMLGKGGKLQAFWDKTRAEAAARNKVPMLIARQARMPALLIRPDRWYTDGGRAPDLFVRGDQVYLLDEFLDRAAPPAARHDQISQIGVPTRAPPPRVGRGGNR